MKRGTVYDMFFVCGHPSLLKDVSSLPTPPEMNGVSVTMIKTGIEGDTTTTAEREKGGEGEAGMTGDVIESVVVMIGENGRRVIRRRR